MSTRNGYRDRVPRPLQMILLNADLYAFLPYFICRPLSTKIDYKKDLRKGFRSTSSFLRSPSRQFMVMCTELERVMRTYNMSFKAKSGMWLLNDLELSLDCHFHWTSLRWNIPSDILNPLNLRSLNFRLWRRTEDTWYFLAKNNCSHRPNRRADSPFGPESNMTYL